MESQTLKICNIQMLYPMNNICLIHRYSPPFFFSFNHLFLLLITFVLNSDIFDWMWVTASGSSIFSNTTDFSELFLLLQFFCLIAYLHCIRNSEVVFFIRLIYDWKVLVVLISKKDKVVWLYFRKRKYTLPVIFPYVYCPWAAYIRVLTWSPP